MAGTDHVVTMLQPLRPRIYREVMLRLCLDMLHEDMFRPFDKEEERSKAVAHAGRVAG